MPDNPTTPAERAALRAAAEAATARPWFNAGQEDMGIGNWVIDTVAASDIGSFFSKPDASYAELAANLAPRLADDVDRLTAERDELQAECNSLAQEAYDEAAPVPLSEERIKDIVAYATGRAKSPFRTEVESLRATVSRLEAALRQAREALTGETAYTGPYDSYSYLTFPKRDAALAAIDAALPEKP